MKKYFPILAIALVGFLASPATAQNLKIERTGLFSDGISQPYTTLFIDIAVESHEIIAGPYARYAQKYLGVSAPLADKVIHEIKYVNISNINDLTQHNESVDAASLVHMTPPRGFPKLPVDRTSGIAVGAEESARLAAEKVFEIRRARFDLITAEAGENVFGAGLGDALDELHHLENEYISLFLGKQTSRTYVRQYRIIPREGEQARTICMFSPTSGLLPTDNQNDDTIGQPLGQDQGQGQDPGQSQDKIRSQEADIARDARELVLDLKPLRILPSELIATLGVQSAKTSAYRIADDVLCRVFLDGAELTSTIIPIFQFGRTVHIPK